MECILCKKQKRVYNASRSGYQEHFWILNNYFGITGSFCSNCYDKVSHDAYREPKRPVEYTMVLLQLN